jgi:threonine/homoserine/homoserine lactone efflux protein
MLEGITAGFILSLTLFPGTVWLAKVGVAGRADQVLGVGLGFACAQMIWLLFAVPGLMMMVRQLHFASVAMYLFAAFVLTYMGIKFIRTKKAERLDDVPELPGAGTLFRNALKQSLAMPMRLPAAMVILLATGVFVNHQPSWEVLPSIIFGTFVGIAWWWGQFMFLAIIFAKRVPYHITLRSLNKIRPLCAVICLSMAGISVFLGT